MRKWVVLAVVAGGVLLLAHYEYKWRLPFSYWLGAQVNKVMRYLLP